jgi:Zn-dependent M28 family amino/carboxypeptidase
MYHKLINMQVSYRILLSFFIVFSAFASYSKTIADAGHLKAHVLAITSGPGFRHIDDTAALNKACNYIRSELGKFNPVVETQDYLVNNKEYRNIIASFGPENAPRIIVGAHYDVCEEQQGADDNASGVAGILELARLLSQTDTKNWKHRVDIVAYTLEEPPSFRQKEMGSAVHAKDLYEKGVEVKGMISVEMIGYYDERKNSQHYPIGFLKLFYGSKGNFITVVGKMNGGKFARQFTRSFKKHPANITAKVFKGPKWVPGLDFSDHLNYWMYGWSALMITDTSFYRNDNYHKNTDTPATLNYKKMSAVVDKLYEAVVRMAS